MSAELGVSAVVKAVDFKERRLVSFWERRLGMGMRGRRQQRC